MEITPIISSDFLIFDSEMFLSEMIGQLRTYEKRAGLVFKNNKYLGLVEKKRLLRSRLDAANTKVGSYIHRTPIIDENATVVETSYLMYQSDVDYLPVQHGKEIIGVLSGLDLVKLAMQLPEAKGFKVNDVQIVKLPMINKSDQLATVLDLMYNKRVDQVPVFEQGRLYGVISYRDILRRYLNWSPKREHSLKFNKMVAKTKGAEGEIPHLASLPVENFCTTASITIAPGDLLSKATELMAGSNVSSLVVMSREKNKENVQGLLSVKGILRKIGSLQVPQNFNIKFKGLNSAKLKAYQKYNIYKIASNEAFKLQRQIHNDEFALTIHIKEYDKAGSRQKYSVNLHVEFPSQVITSTQEDWDIETALRKTFNNAKNKIKKKFRGGSSWRRSYQ
ncbi:MAG: CBS domain-containing protein [Nanoarchaeota archaeon]